VQYDRGASNVVEPVATETDMLGSRRRAPRAAVNGSNDVTVWAALECVDRHVEHGHVIGP